MGGGAIAPLTCVEPPLSLGFVHGVDHGNDSCVWLVVTTLEDAWREMFVRQIPCGLVTSLRLLSCPLFCVWCPICELIYLD